MEFKIIEMVENQFIKRLENEAKKCDKFEDFKHDFLIQLKHGTYFHITNDPNFYIDPNKGPRDMSSMSSGGISINKLMITSDLNYWLDFYNDREYVAIIDMSNVNRKDYYQVNRGFGNELFVSNPKNAIVINIFNRNQAKIFNNNYNKSMPKNEQELLSVYERAKRIK